jgi:hypothetical protein
MDVLVSHHLMSWKVIMSPFGKPLPGMYASVVPSLVVSMGTFNIELSTLLPRSMRCSSTNVDYVCLVTEVGGKGDLES